MIETTAHQWPIENKIIDAKALGHVTSRLHLLSKRIVFTNGCFDLLHLGHIETLRKSRSFGDCLIVGLNSDSSVKQLKGDSRPIQDQYTRAMVLASLLFVDYVVIFDEETPLSLIHKIQPDVLVKGGDYTIDKIVGADYVLQNGGQVEIIDILPGHSTTNTISKF